MTDIGVINANGDKIYQYMNFDKIEDFKQGRLSTAFPLSLWERGRGEGSGEA
jgi:hypothetical protein